MTPEQKQKAQDLVKRGHTAKYAIAQVTAQPVEQQVQPKPTISGAFAAGAERYRAGQERIQQRAEAVESVPEALLGGLAAPLSAISAPIGAIGTTAFGLADVAAGGAIGRFMQPIAESKFGQTIGRVDEFTGGALGEAADIATITGVGAGTRGLVTQAGKVKIPEVKSLKDFMSPKKDVAIGASASEKLATEILQVPKRELKEYVKRGEIHPAVEAAVTNIKKVDSFDEWIGNLQTIVKDDFKRLDDIIKKDNFDIDETYLLKLDDYIASEAKTGFRTPAEIATMQKVRDSSLGVLAEGGGKISRAEAQIVKKRLNKIVGPLQKKNELGTITTTESARLTALDKLRAGLKEAVEGGDKAVESINAKYKGLSKAIDFLASREALARKAVEPTMLQKIAAPVIELISASTGAGSAAFVGRQALQMEKRLDKLTSKLKSLAEKEGKIKTEKGVSKGDKPVSENLKEQTPKKEPRKSQSKDQSQKDSEKDVSSVNNTLKSDKKTVDLAVDKKVDKIIDGEVTLFHASPETGIDKLKLSTPEAISDIPGISFSSDLKYAKTFGDNIYKRTITPKNPLIIEDGTTLPKALEKLGFKVKQGFNEEYLLNDIVKKQKWDVIIMKGSPDEIVVLDPKILKK